MLTQIKIKMTVILVNKCLSPESIPWSLCGRSTVTKVFKTHVRDLFIWSIIEEGVERHKFIGTISESDATSKPVLFISAVIFISMLWLIIPSVIPIWAWEFLNSSDLLVTKLLTK